MAIYGGDWFFRHIRSKDPIHTIWLTDSTGTNGNSASFCPDVMAIPNVWDLPIGGMCMPDSLTTPYLPINCNVQVITSGTSATAVVRPGEATAATTTSGASLGYMTWYTYNTDRTTNTLITRRELLDSSWFKGQHFFNNRPMKARLYIQRTPTGIPDLNLIGRRNGAAVNTTNFSAAGTESIISVEVSCGSGSTGSLEFYLAAGAGNEGTGGSNDIQWTLPMFYSDDTSKKGLYIESLGVGGWTSKAWTSSDTVAGSPSYTGQINSAVKAQYVSASNITGISRRIYVIYLGTNDGSLTSAQTQANFETMIDQWRAAEAAVNLTPPGFILMGAPDPGPTLGTRYDGIDAACVAAATKKNTAASPCMAIEMRPIVRKLGANGVVPAALLADGTHRTTAGAQAIMLEVWKELARYTYGHGRGTLSVGPSAGSRGAKSASRLRK